eukprot:2436437-Pyramimonas_sp.AAC.1
MYKPKPRKDAPAEFQDNSLVFVNGAADYGKGGGKGTSASSRSSTSASSPAEVERLLTKLLSEAKDITTKKVLLEQLAEVRATSAAAVKPITAEDAVKRADSALRDAQAKHDQAIAQVMKLRENLQRAESKEADAALVPAKAEAAKKLAITTLAKESGLLTSDAAAATSPTKDGSGAGGVIFHLRWDEDFFKNLDQYECEESEKIELKALE